MTDSALDFRIKHATRIVKAANDTLKAYMLSDFEDARTLDALLLRTSKARTDLNALLHVRYPVPNLDEDYSDNPADYDSGDLKNSVDPYSSDDDNPDSPLLNWQE